MRLRLLKKLEHYGKTYPRGQILQVSKNFGLKLIAQKKAEEYDGPNPLKRKQKMKTNLFKPIEK